MIRVKKKANTRRSLPNERKAMNPGIHPEHRAVMPRGVDQRNGG